MKLQYLLMAVVTVSSLFALSACGQRASLERPDGKIEDTRSY